MGKNPGDAKTAAKPAMAIKIAGAGPSGLAAAITLAKAGYDVELYERGKDCGQRFGGDLQGLENWSGEENVLEEVRNIDIETNFDCDPFFRFDITDGTRTRKVTSPKPLFYLVKRGPQPRSLDSGLKQQAIDSGAKILFNIALPLNEANIIATGPIIKKAAGIAKGIVFETSAPDIAVCLLDRKTAFRGYSYLLITKGYGCLCTAVCGKLGMVNDCFQETQKVLAKLYSFDIKNPRGVGGIGSISLQKAFQSNGQLYVGEAAGIQDALAGFGIKSALTSGHLAAKSIIEGFDYDKAAKEHFRPKMQASVVNRFLFEAAYCKPVIRAGMNWISASKDPLAKLHRMYNLSAMKMAALPLAAFFLLLKYGKFV